MNHQVRILENGSELMPLVTGTGCLLGAVLAASIHLADEDSLLDCLEEVLSAYSIAGEMAGQKTSLPGTFQIEFINSLYAIQSEEVEENKRSFIMNRKMLQVYFICGTSDCPKGKFWMYWKRHCRQESLVFNFVKR